MTQTVAQGSLSPTHQRALQRAFDLLEAQDFAAGLAEYLGQPANRVLRMMPRRAGLRLNRIVEIAMLNCLKLAINSLERSPKRKPALRASSILAGITGGVSGFFGLPALALELPVTTTLMLRGIADVARYHGEDLSRLEARLACIEVFALGARKSKDQPGVGYYASRAFLSRLIDDASTFVIERGATNASAPVIRSVVAEIAARFGIVVSERVAAGALPVVGAFGGATVNVIFMTHFQRVARGHFAIRRLERQYGAERVKHYYEGLALRRQKLEA
ncbi:EcsC protein family protein [Rhizobiales bacterium GAS191]|nr:EcsC protein family protein [Rhizobiales bacterium GAS191]